MSEERGKKKKEEMPIDIFRSEQTQKSDDDARPQYKFQRKKIFQFKVLELPRHNDNFQGNDMLTLTTAVARNEWWMQNFIAQNVFSSLLLPTY